MQSPSGKRVRLCHYRPGFAHSVHSILPHRICIESFHQLEMIRPDSLLHPLELLPEAYLLDLSSASCTETSCDPTCHSTRTHQQKKKNCLFLRCTTVSLAIAFLLPFPFLAFLTFSLGDLHLPDVHRCRRVWSRVRPKIVVVSFLPVSTLARTQARLGKSHDVLTEPLSRDHGKLLARVPSQSVLGPSAGGLHLRKICTAQRLSPGKRACHQGRILRCASFPIWHVG